jgi:hypothetical protein
MCWAGSNSRVTFDSLLWQRPFESREGSQYYGELVDHDRVHVAMKQVIMHDLERIPGMALPPADEGPSNDSESEDELERRDATELAGATDNLINV